MWYENFQFIIFWMIDFFFFLNTKLPYSQKKKKKKLSPFYGAYDLSISSISIPHNWRKAFADSKWNQAVIEEIKVLSKNETWELPHTNTRQEVGWSEMIQSKIGR